MTLQWSAAQQVPGLQIRMGGTTTASTAQSARGALAALLKYFSKSAEAFAIPDFLQRLFPQVAELHISQPLARTYKTIRSNRSSNMAGFAGLRSSCAGGDILGGKELFVLLIGQELHER